MAEGSITTLANTIIHIQSSGDGHAAATASSLAMTSFGIPLTGIMSAGFTIGFIKGWLFDNQKSKWCCWSFDYDRSVKKTERIRKKSGSLKSRMCNIV